MRLLTVIAILSLAVISGCAGPKTAPVLPAAVEQPPPKTTPTAAVEQLKKRTSLTAAEAQLADRLNEMRTGRGLPPVPVTTALYQTARWHIIDLTANAPHKGTQDSRGGPCTLNSWSAAGKTLGGWQPLCYTADHKNARGMWKKPQEITGYPGNGYELVYWSALPATPEGALKAWEKSSGERAIILEEGKWKDSNWRALGVRIDGNYAAVWFGSSTDDQGIVPREQR